MPAKIRVLDLTPVLAGPYADGYVSMFVGNDAMAAAILDILS